MRVLVLADTHVRPGRGPRLPAAVYGAAEHADAVLHAGDVLARDLLDELSGFAPVHAVLGNNDRELVGALPDRLCLELAGVPIAMVHDSGSRKGRAARLHRWFPDARVVVFGHSHQPVDTIGVNGQRLFNPGSPTQRRRSPQRTFGILELDRGEIGRHEIVGLASA